MKTKILADFQICISVPLEVYCRINEKSLVRSLAISFLSLTVLMVKIDLLYTNSFVLHFNTFGKSLIYM